MLCRPEAKPRSDAVAPEDIKADHRNPSSQGLSEKWCAEKQRDDRGPCSPGLSEKWCAERQRDDRGPSPGLSEKQWMHPCWRSIASPRTAMQGILKDAECKLGEVFEAREAELLNEICSLQRENHHLQTLLDRALLPRADGTMSRHRRVQEAEMATHGCLPGIGWDVGASQQLCHGLPEKPQSGGPARLSGEPIQEDDGGARRATVGTQVGAVSPGPAADRGTEWGQQPDGRLSFATPDFGGRSRMTSIGDSSPSDDDEALCHLHFPGGPRAGAPLPGGGLWHARKASQCGVQLGTPPGSVQKYGIEEPRHSMEEARPTTTMGDVVLSSLERDRQASNAIVGI